MNDGDRVLAAGVGCRVPVEEVSWRFETSGKPGGQHANRARTRVVAELDLRTSRGLDEQVRVRLLERVGPTIRVVIDRYRSQSRNRERALDEVERQLQYALIEQARRRPTRPRKAAVERRLEAKRRRGVRKAERRGNWN